MRFITYIIFIFLINAGEVCGKSHEASAEKSPLRKGRVIVEVEGLRNDMGLVRISLYKSEEGFPTKPEKALKSVETDIDGSRAAVIFEGIPYGEYALSLLHDENGNKKMDFSWLMIPAEGFGASNMREKRLLPPGFKDAAFRVDDKEKIVHIYMHY